MTIRREVVTIDLVAPDDVGTSRLLLNTQLSRDKLTW